MVDRHILYKLQPGIQGEKVADAEDVEVDASGFDGNLDTSDTSVQAVAQALDDLSLPALPGSVAASDVSVVTTELPANTDPNAQAALDGLADGLRTVQNTIDQRQRAITLFDSNVTVQAGNFDTFANKNAIYSATTDQRVTFLLPLESAISSYPVVFQISHFGGTRRFDTGITPNNSVRIDVQGTDTTQLQRPSGTLLNFAELHRGDVGVITKRAAGENWIIEESSSDPRSSLLPQGAFVLNSRTVTLPDALGFIAGLSLYTPQEGDAFEITSPDATTRLTGFEIGAGDVIVALSDNPSLALNSSNTDWLVIRNAGNFPLTFQEIRFLAQVSEVDAFEDTRLIDRSDVSAARVWLSPFILDHAPFITPSTDPDNPQAGETDPYVGGSEDSGTGNEFELASNAFRAFVYVDIDGTFDTTNDLGNVFLVHKDIDGTEVERFSLTGDFRPIVLPGSTDTYYVFDDVAAADNFSSINYHANQTLELIYRNTLRSFNLSSSVNAIPAIADGALEITKLNPTVQALIRTDHSLTVDEEKKLEGLNLNTSTAALGISEPLYVKLNDASADNNLAHYQNVQNGNGIIPDYERTRQVFFLVETDVNVTQLQKVDTPATKHPVTSEGIITTTDGQRWQAFSATLPAITGANSPLDNSWQVDGTKNTSVLGSAVNSFKIDRDNLSDTVVSYIESLIPDTPSAPALPDPLPQLITHLQVTESVSTAWTSVTPHPIRATLTREFAALWDENRRSFGAGNYFADLTNVEVIGFAGNNIFYYNTPTDALNTSFRGAQSYILNSNVRIRNTGGGTNIDTTFRKIIGFDYALQRTLSSGENFEMLRLGSAGSTPLIGLSEDDGLYVNIGRNDGGQRTRTRNISLPVSENQWGTRVGETTSGEAEIIVPDSLSGSVTITVSIQLDDNGNDEGTHTEDITITNVGTDQNIGNRTFNFAGFPSVTVAFNYDAVNNDLSNARRVLFATPTAAFSNAALTYNVSATYPVTETWNVSATYARLTINAGNSHDDFGLFDPHLYTTETVRSRNRVLLSLQKFREDDTETDPEIALRVVVDGEHEVGNGGDDGFLIRTHRPASDFTFDDMSFGNNVCAIAHIQEYRYTGDAPSEAELLRLYANGNNWLGAFYAPGHEVDDVVFDANIEATNTHALILTDTTLGTRHSLEIDNGAVLIKTV